VKVKEPVMFDDSDNLHNVPILNARIEFFDELDQSNALEWTWL